MSREKAICETVSTSRMGLLFASLESELLRLWILKICLKKRGDEKVDLNHGPHKSKAIVLSTRSLKKNFKKCNHTVWNSPDNLSHNFGHHNTLHCLS